ncbi:MAG: [Lachnospiraceae bacterium]|nr:[FeFe] hydrogenase H-cluster radical SAM maturase HydE [Lachnospiraceae bacterium]
MDLVEKLKTNKDLTDEEFLHLLNTDAFDNALQKAADEVRRSVYGDEVFLRGLIEFTNYCKNNCYYCGIRGGNANAERYRLTKEEIMECCLEGYRLGFRTFVLQGGEDYSYTDEDICDIVRTIKRNYPDAAVTLSIGERSKETYKKYKEAGADRYLLRHETATEEHYRMLHPEDLSLENRKQCLFDLKELGFQVGAGFMVGSPGQKKEHIVSDFRFLQKLQPDMIGIGPFIPHKDTVFKDEPAGSLELTLRILSILRLLFPYVLLPATTALGTIAPNGRELGLKHGANVVMPNLSPKRFREQYSLYDNKICTGEEAAECKRCLEVRVNSAGYRIVDSRGDVKK